MFRIEKVEQVEEEHKDYKLTYPRKRERSFTIQD